MPKTIDLKAFFQTYGEKVVKVRCRAEGFRNSEFATKTVNNIPLIKYNVETLDVSNVLSGIESYDLYIDGILAKTYEHDPTSVDDFSIDLTEFNMELGIVYKLEIEVHVGNDAFRSEQVDSNKILGVSGLYNSTVELTRTDNAEGLTFAIDASTGLISSDFDNEFPYNEMKVVKIDGNSMVYIPAMYFRIGTDDVGNLTDIAVCKSSSRNGDWYYVKPFYYSTYQGYVTNSKLTSQSGVNPTSNINIGSFRTYAESNGAGYHQLDLYHKTIMNFLWLIEFASKDSASIMTGFVNGNGKRNTGGTDILTTPSGYVLANKQMRWHNIEDFVGNVCDFLDGINGNYYATSDTSLYSADYSSKNKLSYVVDSSSSRCIASFGWDSNNPFLCMPKATVNNTSYNTHYCDRCYINGGTSYIYYCGSYYGDSSASYGVFFVSHIHATTSDYIIGARLLYSPE